MKNKKVNYSNRQVKGEEDVFSPFDTDAELVGGINQSDPYGYSLAYSKQQPVDLDDGVGDGSTDISSTEVSTDDERDEEEKLGTISSVSFEQTGSFTGDGTFLANVTVTLSGIKGATNYEVEFTKIS